jgi:hypothetical protein
MQRHSRVRAIVQLRYAQASELHHLPQTEAINGCFDIETRAHKQTCKLISYKRHNFRHMPTHLLKRDVIYKPYDFSFQHSPSQPSTVQHSPARSSTVQHRPPHFVGPPGLSSDWSPWLVILVPLSAPLKSSPRKRHRSVVHEHKIHSCYDSARSQLNVFLSDTRNGITDIQEKH